MATGRIPTIPLNNGTRYPLVGLGTLGALGDELKLAIKCAIESGYRHIDTAHKYYNEEAIGEAIKEAINSGIVTRDELFITSKLARARMGVNSVRPSLEASLKRLQLDYLDLYLIHSPFGYKNREDGDLLPKDENGKLEYQHYDAVETWKEMEKLVDSGKVRNIGVSNFNSVQLDYVCRHARILPVTNQVEVHAYLPQYALNEFCRSRGIVLTAYAPLGARKRAGVYQRENDPVLLEEDVVVRLAKKYGKSPAQILLRDLVQRGIPVVPKSVNPSRMKDNIQITQGYMCALTRSSLEILCDPRTNMTNVICGRVRKDNLSKIFDFELSQEDVVALAELNKIQRRFFDMLWMAEGHPDYPFTAAY